MDALAHKFWWKPNGFEGRFLTLLSWDNLCKPKCKGGLGFKKKPRTSTMRFLSSLLE